MVERKFKIVRPNLYTTGIHTCFGVELSDIVPVSRAIDNVISEYVGSLKVSESDMETLRNGKSGEKERIYNIPLSEYLSLLEKENALHGKMISNELSASFNLGHTVMALVANNQQKIYDWMFLKDALNNPDEVFDSFEADNNGFLRLNRAESLEKIKQEYERLSPVIPDVFAGLYITSGYSPVNTLSIREKAFGVVTLSDLKEDGKGLIKKVRPKLIKQLKGFRGPCLSLDAVDLYSQAMRISSDAPELADKYGDILTNSTWRTGFFRIDP